jgi:CubicO group peptidase (beta-lactamase class C family)
MRGSLILDEQTGMAWHDLLDEKIFDPLWMTQTTAYASEPPAKGWPVALHAAGGMHTTARDAARWLDAQLNHGGVDGQQVFPAEVIETVQRPLVAADAS